MQCHNIIASDNVSQIVSKITAHRPVYLIIFCQVLSCIFLNCNFRFEAVQPSMRKGFQCVQRAFFSSTLSCLEGHQPPYHWCHLIENEGQILSSFYAGMFLFALLHSNVDTAIYHACAQRTYVHF